MLRKARDSASLAIQGTFPRLVSGGYAAPIPPLNGSISDLLANAAVTFSIFLIFIFYSAVPCFGREKLTFDDSRKNIGIYLNEPDDFWKFSNHPDIVAWFEPWFGKVSTTKLNICNSRKYAIPLITWEPNNAALSEIVSGKFDDYINSFLKTVKKHTKNTDVLIRFAHEMEMRPEYQYAWYPWQSERDPETYIAAWRHIVDIGREIDPSMKWVWSPNRADEHSDRYYPGDEYVDYVGITLNLREDAKYYDLYENFRDFYVMEGTREHLVSYGKKIIITEVGYSNPDPETQQQYIRSVFDYLLEDPMLTGIVFFNERVKSYRDYSITGDPALMEEFKAGIKRLHASPGSSPHGK